MQIRVYEDEIKNGVLIEVSRLENPKYLSKLINAIEEIKEEFLQEVFSRYL